MVMISWLKIKRKYQRCILVAALPVLITAGKIISSAIVDWDKITAVKSRTGWTRNLYKGATRSLDILEVQAFTLYPGKATHSHVVDRQNDEVYLVKEGGAEVSINNISRHLGEGGVAVAVQDNRIMINNKGLSNLVYYSIRLKPKYVKQTNKTTRKEKPILALTDTLKSEPTLDGALRSIYNKVTPSLHNLDIHISSLKTDFNRLEPQTHTEEELVLINKGNIFGSLKSRPYRLGHGSFLFLTNEDQVEISNGSPTECEYYVIRWLAWSQEPKK